MAAVAPPTDPCCLIGLQISMPASVFGNAWAKEKFGAQWRVATCVGYIRSVKVGNTKTRRVTLWNVEYEDGTIHPLNWNGVLLNADVEDCKRRLQSDAAKQGGAGKESAAKEKPQVLGTEEQATQDLNSTEDADVQVRVEKLFLLFFSCYSCCSSCLALCIIQLCSIFNFL